MMQASRLLRFAKLAFISDEVMTGTIRLGLFHGVKTLAVPTESVQMRLGLWERETYKYIRQAAKTARWVIDIGAGSGEHSLFFSLRTRADPILAVEPGSPDLVRQNIELNHALNIEILDKELGTGAGQVRLDSLSVPRQVVGFIKLDADGAELDILRSGEGLLREARPLLLVETHSAALERDCFDLLSDISYKITIIPNAWWRRIVPEQRPLDHNRWLWAKPS
jgi:hypothetical protein